MTRRQMREQVFKQLFLSEFYNGEEESDQCRLYLEAQELPVEDDELSLSQEDQEQLYKRASDVKARYSELDEKLNEASEGWKTNRMAKVDLCILRLALYEIIYDEDVPLKVGINEAVELAKRYGGDDSPAFVNAILGKAAKGL